jgi:hypothetical protein
MQFANSVLDDSAGAKTQVVHTIGRDFEQHRRCVHRCQSVLNRAGYVTLELRLPRIVVSWQDELELVGLWKLRGHTKHQR